MHAWRESVGETSRRLRLSQSDGEGRGVNVYFNEREALQFLAGDVSKLQELVSRMRTELDLTTVKYSDIR